ncbi:hypothetical protein WJX79_006946 [Trebouxia sp. C0005]
MPLEHGLLYRISAQRGRVSTPAYILPDPGSRGVSPGMRRFQCLDVRVVVKQLAEVGLSIVSQGFAYYLARKLKLVGMLYTQDDMFDADVAAAFLQGCRYRKDTGGATGDSYQSTLYQQLLVYVVPRPFAESTANVGDPVTHIYASVLAWIETVVVWLMQGNTTMPIGNKALKVAKVHYNKFWDETLKRTSACVNPATQMLCMIQQTLMMKKRMGLKCGI